MSAQPEGKFQDHYKVLGIEPSADSEAIQSAYSQLARKYHPNNRETGDKAKFDAVNLAYEVLVNPAAKQAFDMVRSGGVEREGPLQFSGKGFFLMVAKEQTHRMALLCLLYDRRRQKPSRPGISMRQIESMLSTTSDEILFSINYLKQRGLLSQDDKSNLQITVQGMEFLEHNLPEPEAVLALLKPSAIVGSDSLLQLQSAIETARPAPEPAPPPEPVAPRPTRRVVIPPRN